MRNALCPQCGASVDPFLGPAPVVIGDRVAMCCSTACARALLDKRDVSCQAPEASTARGKEEEEAVLGERAPPVLGEPAPQSGEDLVAAEKSARPRRGWWGRLRIGPSGAALMVAGLTLVLVAIYLVMEYGRVAPSPSPSQSGEDLALAELTGQGRDGGIPLALSGALPPGVLPGGPPDPEPPLFLELQRRSMAILEGFLSSEVIRFRLAAAEVLAEAGNGRALEALKGELGAGLWSIRQMAAEPLARLGHEEGLAALREGLASPRSSVRWSAAYALARAGDATGAPILRQIAHVRIHRITANEALVRLGDQRGRRVLHAVLAGDDPPYDRLRAAVALGQAGDHAALPLLVASLDEPQMRLGVALALQRLGSPLARPALEQALEHAALRVEGARALRGQGEVTGLRSLGRSLDSAHPETRLSAAASIVILTAQAEAEVSAVARGEVP